LGGSIRPASTPTDARSQDVTEFEFHISPACSSSRPHTAVGTSATVSRISCPTGPSSATRTGLAILDDRSEMVNR
jgi:hypothetical protein